MKFRYENDIITLCIVLIILLMILECNAKADDTINDDCLDPSGYTWLETPTREAILIGRIADGIQRVKGDHFYVCGEKLDKIEKEKYSIKLAYMIVKNGYDINPWGLAGTMANESGFDYCALGLNPRKWAVNYGLLEEKKMSISYKRSEILNVINDDHAKDVFAHSGFDLGLCQMLTKYYLSEYEKPEDLLTVYKGIDICINKMNEKAYKYDTRRPWRWWRGSETDWYDKKITKWARRMGARIGEI